MFCTVLLTSEVVMVQPFQPKGCVYNPKVVSARPCVFLFVCVCFFYLYSICLGSFIIDVTRPLSNVLWITLFQKVDV